MSVELLASLSPVQQMAVGCAAAATIVTLGCAAIAWIRSLAAGPVHRRACHAGFVFALLFGVASAVMHVVMLTMRLMQAGMEVIYGYPWPVVRDRIIGSWGVVTLGALCVSTLLATAVTRQSRLLTCLLWEAAILVVWTAALWPTVRPNGTGGFERTEVLLLTIAALSVATALATVPVSWTIRRRSFARGGGPAHGPPGFATSVCALAVIVGLLVLGQLLIPLRLSSGGVALQAAVLAASAGLVALCALLLVESGVRTSGLAEAAFGLGSLAGAGLWMALVPLGGGPAGELYPKMLNSLLAGFTATAAACAIVETRRRKGVVPKQPALAFLSQRAGRFLFYNGVVAFLMAMMMATWPRLPGIAVMDDSCGRLLAGVSANAALLLLMLWSARRIPWITLRGMCILVVCSTAGFLATRMLPFASHVN